ncbi:MAG: hypothetical protein JWO11_3541 [Nocardioides sp.]|nr:hypothetical protein [Nocardioides sp.]
MSDGPAEEIAANKWTEEFWVSMGEGKNWADVAKAVITDRRPGTKFRFPKLPPAPKDARTEFAFGMTVDNNPWQDAEDMAWEMGMRLRFDDDDVCVMEPEERP